MILQSIFYNNFELLIPEFFITLIILSFLLFGTFYKNIDNKKILIIKTINNLIIFLLLFTLLLMFNTQNISMTLMNGALFIDNLTQFIKSILIICTILCYIIQTNYIIKQKMFSFEINILILISLLGLMLLVSSFNFITLYLAVELQSLSFYILTASKRKSPLAVEAALKYFILGSIASSFILFGSSLIYGVFGSLNFGNIFLILSNVYYIENIDLIIGALNGFLFIFIGLFFKIGAAPFHFWLPDVYEGAPNNVTAFFAIVPKIAFIGILIRFVFDILIDISSFFEIIFYISAISSMFIGSLAALQQKKIKRLLAYSSISHVGFILIGFTSNLLESIPYILLYIVVYIIMSINLWTSYLSLIINKKPIKYLTDLSNLYNFNKILAFIIVLNVFSMSGIPPLAGFFSKLFLFITAIKAQYFGLIFFSILVSILSSFYYLRMIKIIFFEKISKKLFVNQITKLNSIILVINTQFLLLFFLYPNIILINLNKLYLYLLI
ncbi:NADH dehydrogenase subunit 2 (mitochondrion) [Saprolegnia parasitica CBS 223.65]|uniref:NADH dehydrogenase subunit 2 n=1 Tax=Saprolegnia parasitica (strain CBS 223.65) TaxID=695850 RepID=A0A067BG47_SAPPC|nr:NADH dehydrogenase subunit 2 [Saprolegnia parasitica CBS 223.65]KDO15675.1 NADH dehydrogenase subunit 2 [Saprolegnia parasitica CBS 223.65]|eukprot:XP_012213605.1 NADH dehydrogenase subunit 2 (mitochondrion) [Saprolegnia parasitica CBS 223.65]